MSEIGVRVNGREQRHEVEPRVLLVDFIRSQLRLTGTHVGCDTSSCGACTVLLDGEPVKSCTLLAVEGVARGAELHPVQVGFHEEHGLQCGFCTPGMMLVAAALLERNPEPSEEEIRWAISGNICRCTGYVNIVKAIQHAARLRREAAQPAAAGGAG